VEWSSGAWRGVGSGVGRVVAWLSCCCVMSPSYSYSPCYSYSYTPSLLHSLTLTVLSLLLAGWTTPSEIQAQSIPEALRGRDVIGLAETGSGKTGRCALALPSLPHCLTQYTVSLSIHYTTPTSVCTALHYYITIALPSLPHCLTQYTVSLSIHSAQHYTTTLQ
jgi:hypothetical protein